MEVKHIAKLARIDLTDEELKKIEKDLSAVLDYFEMLKEVDVSNVEPTFHPNFAKASLDKPNEQRTGFLREDEDKIKSEGLAEKLIELAPDKDKRYIRVKAVF